MMIKMPDGTIDITLTSCFTGVHLKRQKSCGFFPDPMPVSACPLGVFLNDNQGKPDIRGF
jgi:hypothetical protein